MAPFLFEYRSVETFTEGRRFDHLVESVELDDEIATVRYRDSYTWWNGTQVTARDDWTGIRIEQHLSGEELDADRSPEHTEAAIDPATLDVELVDEYTLRYSFPEPLHPTVMEDAVAHGIVNTPATLFEPWVEQFESATTTGDHGEVEADFRTWTIGADELMEEGAGCGPFELTMAESTRYELDTYPGHPLAEDIAIDVVRLPIADGNRKDELLLQGELDFGDGPLDLDTPTHPDHVEELDRYRLDHGFKLLFNWRNDHIATRGVRRAIASVLPIPDILENAEMGIPTEVQTGMGAIADEQWFDEEFLDSLVRYPVDADEESAVSFMEEAGYRRTGGEWHDPDGEPVRLRLVGPTWDRWTVALLSVESALDTFGFDVSTDAIEAGTFYERLATGGFDIAPWWSGSRPFGAYNVTSAWPSGLGYGTDDPERETSPYDKPVRVTIPTDVGALTDDDGNEEINLVEQWRTLRSAPNDEEVSDAAAVFAQWWNYDLPDLHVSDVEQVIWGNTRDFVWPDAGDAVYRTYGPERRPDIYTVNAGAVSPVVDGTDDS